MTTRHRNMVSRLFITESNRMNAFATTNAEIGEMLTRSSAAMKAANNSLEQTIALESAAVEITRNAETTGTAFRTVSMRIRGLDEETEEELEDYEELKGKIADLTKTKSTPGGISLFTDESKTTFKSTYQILKEISEIWDDISDKDQAALLETIAGKRGGQVLAGILDDFSQVDKAMETMEGAAGSAEREMDIIRDSLAFKINELKETWVGVLQQITSRGGLGEILDTLNSISKTLGKIISDTGLLKTALIGLGAVIGSSKLGILNTKDSGTLFGSIAQKFSYRDEKKQYQSILDQFNGKNGSTASPNDFLTTDFTKWTHLSNDVRTNLINIKKEAKSGAEALNKVEDAMVHVGEKGTKLGNSIKNIGKSILNGFVTGALVWGLTTAIDSLAKYIDKKLNPSKYIQKAAKKAREEIANIKSELKSTTDVVDEVKMRYAQLAQEVKNVGTIAQSQGTLSDDEYKEFLDISNQLAEVFPTLTRGYDENGKAIVSLSGDVDTIVGSLEHLVDVERQVANANISKQLPKDWAGYVDSLKSANKDAEGLKYIIGEIENIRGKRQISTTNSVGLVDKALEIAQIKSKTRSSIIDKAEDHGDTRSYDLSELSIDEYNAFQNALATLSNQYSRQLDQTESTMKSQTVDFYNNILSLFSEDSFYKGLSDTEQKIFQGLLMTYDFDSLAQSMGDNWEAAFAQIQYDLISKFNNVSPEDKGLIEEYYNEIFSIDTSEGVFAENIEKIKEYISKLAELLGVDQIDLMNIFGLGDIDTKLNKAKGAWKTKSDYSSKDIENVLKNYSAGGNVDLTNRPKVDSSYMRKAGWTDVNGGYATVYTGTYNNKEGTRYLNFTPIIVDPKTGEFKGVLTPDELSEYAEGVIAGTRTDDLNLQIGAEFNTVEAAEAAAEAIHKYSELITSEDYSSEGEMGYMSIDPRKITEEQNLRKEYEKFIDSLEESDLDIWNAALNNGKIDPEILRSGEEGLREYLKELQKIAEDNAIKPISAVDTVDAMADMKSAVASLGDLWNQTVQNQIKLGKDKKYLNENGEVEKQYDENGQAIGFADPELINNVEQAFKKFIETSDKAGKDITEMNFALEEFERIMIEQPGDVDAAQSAIDNLITSYIDQTNIIKKLDESNKEWAKTQLKAMGITNADAVVEARLSKKTKELMANITKLAKAYDKLADAKEGSKEYADAISGIAVELESMLDLDDIEINEEFVVKNLDLIRQAASGNAEAINQLRKEAAKEIVAQIHIEGNTQEIMGYQDYINNLIDNFDIEDVEVGAVLHDNAMIDGLNNLVDAGIITRDSMNKILSGIGVEPIQTKGIDVDIEAYNQAKAMGLTGQALTEATKALKARIRVPGIEYHVVSKGTGAKYSAPSGGGSSSGGGGGGGGSEPTQPKEEAEESFDWIEVAIQRIEEQITRLDKVVGNSYTLWGNRNKALADELDEITKKIEAEGIAQQEYLRNADKVQVNNGKGLNDDDYGENDELVKARDQELLDAAKKAWATGEYQRKVREGQMSGNDIEKIQNHFLADTIKEYQELYNKAVQAGDAVYDAMLERAGKYEERFNMVKDEYAELIQYVTDAADVIDEKINRTEKHGYFVSKSYYEQLKELEAQHGTYLQNEYNELVKKRDEAVSSGAIEEGSSAWNKMNQEINSVNLELEQHLTKMLEYNNTIRQLDWDFFDWVEERISRINDEASFLVDLMSNDKLYEDNGFLNNLGHATNAMYAAQYEVYMRQAKDYANERLKLEKEIAKDPANKDLIARYEELVDAQQDAIKGAEQMKDSVKSLVQEGINLYLQSLQKLIDKYKESLSDAKDLYSYQQNIAEQTKNIGNLRKQLTAYEGDDSEETRATVQRLRTQLKDAETKLKETEWDRYISETESFLSDMYTDMEETLNARLDDIDLLMHDMIDVANENSATVQDTIRTETDKVGYTLTSYFDGIVNGGSVLTTDLNNGFTQISGLMTNVLSVIEQIKNYAATMVDNGKTKVESTKTTTVNTNAPTAPKATGNTTTTTSNNKPATNTTNNNNKPVTNTTNNNKPARSETDYYGVALAIINGTYGWGNGDNRVSRLKQKGFDPVKVQNLVNKLWDEGYVFSGAWVGRYQGITDLSKYSYNKYAKGSKRISHDQMAITQEKGAEMIFRNDDGSLLMPLGTGDKVFTAQMTDNLWELAKGKFTTNIPKTGGGNTINNSNAINITLPNVTNYEQFKTQLQNDPKMTSFIQQITLGEVSNGIKLNKRKY